MSSQVQESQMLAHMAKMMGGGSNGRRSPDQKDPRTKAHEEKHRKIQAMEAYKNRPGRNKILISLLIRLKHFPFNSQLLGKRVPRNGTRF